ncbi:UDP-2,4-diacetamido-2,4,6-trideoxy-beta-L-altropyranose hydrolase [Tabrizicola sp.]|uniref:UDP-2,4-diacetamido-2,4, 6-trideoxy-beta-L-altropyranose hydrolase n=1 Tax=Tabrizicola sp. TaxID=2005166 RepID=UPI002609B1E2|nr:UDP-2,4-diacetamido-2,4,6-trideoxy-beta-L-altropyranose hydrolase [Tabrizicola sp.]MDM7932011.1 UDP-2,4-diacetamido-2,4,6-trideoxy-beta-L-altropyranose hydrolase [Tabrizicola sp.]
MSLRLAFRVDASIVIGTGHVVRCLSLARALREQGAEVAFVMRNLPGNMISRVAAEGFKVLELPTPAAVFDPAAATDHVAWAGVPAARDAVETAAALAGTVWDWLIVDHYAFGREWEVAARPPTARLMVIDDLADRAHECDLLLDQNLGRRAGDYDALLPPRTRRLIGPAYALLRPEFAALRAGALAARGGPLRHVLIAMGGIDAPDVTGTLLQALPDGVQVTAVMGSAAPALGRVRALAQARGARLLVDTLDMAQVMAEADLAIGGVGGSAWERCVLGLPTLMVVMADNQEAAAAALVATRAARLIGRAGDPALPARLAAEIAALSAERLADMSARAAALCDGRGLPRVLRALCAPPLRLRAAVPDDAQTVWNWRAGLAATRAFRSPEVPPLAAHLLWFNRALNTPSRRLYMAETTLPAGHLRLDDAELPGEATISILLDPAARAQGLGAALLAAAEAEARRLHLTTLRAEVHETNAPSCALFAAAGYVRTGQDDGFLHLTLTL